MLTLYYYMYRYLAHLVSLSLFSSYSPFSSYTVSPPSFSLSLLFLFHSHCTWHGFNLCNTTRKMPIWATTGHLIHSGDFFTMFLKTSFCKLLQLFCFFFLCTSSMPPTDHHLCCRKMISYSTGGRIRLLPMNLNAYTLSYASPNAHTPQHPLKYRGRVLP